MGDNPYKDGRHAIRNAITCLLAIRNAVDNGAITLLPGGEQPGNYAHVCDTIEWLKRHPQAVDVVHAGPPTPHTMPAHDSPPVTTGDTTMIGAFRIVMNPRTFKFSVERHWMTGWTAIMRECAGSLWPWREFDTVDDAENAIVEYGRAIGTGVTLVREELNEIITAAPGHKFAARQSSRPMIGDRREVSDTLEIFTNDGWMKIGTIAAAPPPTHYPHDHTGTPIVIVADVNYFRINTDDQGQFIFEWWSSQNGWEWTAFCPKWREFLTLMHQQHALEDTLSIWHSWREHKGSSVELISSTCNPHGEAPIPIETTTPLWERHNVTPVTLTADTNIPEHDGTFRIMPNVLKPDDGWSIRQWHALHGKWSLTPLGTFSDYWSAVDRVKEVANAKSEPTYLVTPSEREIEYWANAGFTIKAPPITTTAQELLEILKDGAARELNIPPMPAPEIGCKTPVPVENGFWAIDEWTATGWNRIADELDWEEVEDKLRPAAVSTDTTPPPGTCEIRAGKMPGDVWDVFQWTGRSWKEIAGNVTKRTAEGVVRARAMDPENPVATPLAGTVVKSYRRIVKTVRSDLVNLDGDIQSWLASPKPTMAPDELLRQISNQINGIMKSIEDGISVQH